MIKLTDMQLLLLSTAMTREDGSLLPPAESLGTRFDRIRRSVEALVTKGLACEFVVAEQARSWRHDDGSFYGVMISEAGRAALDGRDGAGSADIPPNGGSEKLPSSAGPPPGAAAQGTAVAVAPRADSKAAQVVALLKRGGGASLPEIVELTGWLPHTARAVLTGLRKKGHAIVTGKVDGVTRYTIAAAA